MAPLTATDLLNNPYMAGVEVGSLGVAPPLDLNVDLDYARALAHNSIDGSNSGRSNFIFEDYELKLTRVIEDEQGSGINEIIKKFTYDEPPQKNIYQEELPIKMPRMRLAQPDVTKIEIDDHLIFLKKSRRDRDLSFNDEPKQEKHLNFFEKQDSLLDSLKGELDRSESPTQKEEPKVRAFRAGYIDGLKEFITKNNITGNLMTKSNSLESLLMFSLPSFASGSHLEAPLPLMGVTSESPGYVLGFVIAIAREYQVTMDAAWVPSGVMEYHAFKQGLKAKEKSVIDQDSNIFGSNEIAYRNGLTVWLKSQGIQSVTVNQVRHPITLKEFKLALEDEPKMNLSLTFDRGYKDNKISISESLYNKKSIPSSENALSDSEYRKAMGRILGKVAKNEKVKYKSRIRPF